MSDLPSGSTVGGKLIIHKGIANKHRHHASEIEGLVDSGNTQGDGGGIDATFLSGYTFNDLSNEFLNVSSDSISSLILANHPTNDNEAASKLYISQRATEGFTNGDFYGLTSIGTVSQELSYVVLNQYVVRINSTDIMVNGWLGVLPEQNIDIRDINANFTNKSFYLFVESVENTFTITGSETRDLNTANKIYAGRIDTDGNGIAQVDIVSGVSRFGIGKYMLSQNPSPDSIVISKDTGLIDDGWLVGSKGETRTFLDGPTQGVSNDQLQFNITNFNSFSDYDVSTSLPDLGVSIIGDVVTVNTPIRVPVDAVAPFTVIRDGFETTFNLDLIGDPAPTISGPSTLQSGGTYTYTIDNYDANYTYTASSDITGITTTSIVGDTVTISTSSKNPYIQSGYIEIAREGKSTQISVTYDKDPDIGLTGPTTVFANNTYNYTITNFNSSYTYTISSTLGTVSRSGDQIVLNTSGIPDTESGNTIRIDVSREGSSAFIEATYSQTYVLNAPEDFDPNMGGILQLGMMFHDKYGIGQQDTFVIYGTTYYGPLSLPDGIYEINIHPKSNNIIYNEVDGGGSDALTFSFDGFPTTSPVTVTVYGNVVGRGGDAGGFYDFNLSERGTPTAPQDGGSGLYVKTEWTNGRDVPITLDLSNAQIYTGGGGGASAYDIVVSSDGTNPNYVNPDGSFQYVREGIITGATGGKSALGVPDGADAPSQVLDSTHPLSTESYQVNYAENPTDTTEGRIRHYDDNLRSSAVNYWAVHHGGIGGGIGQSATRPFIFDYDDAQGTHTTTSNYSVRGYYSDGSPSSSTSNYGLKIAKAGQEIKFNRDNSTGYNVIR